MVNIDSLIVGFKNKEKAAFEKLYTMYGNSIHGVIYNIVKNEDLAEELVQDTFIKAWNNAETYSSKKGRFFTWILNIGRNTAIDATRSKAFKNERKNQEIDYFVNTIQDNQNLDKQTDAIGILEFVKQLGDRCIKLIELLYFKGYTQKEASEEMDSPVGTIKTWNRKCIQNLRDKVL